MTNEDHFAKLWERERAKHHECKSMLFDAWRTMAAQTRGLQRQRRLIRRLQAQIARAGIQQKRGLE